MFRATKVSAEEHDAADDATCSFSGLAVAIFPGDRRARSSENPACIKGSVNQKH